MIVSDKMKRFAVEEMKTYHALRFDTREPMVCYPNYIYSAEFKKIETEYLPGMEFFYKFNFSNPDDLKFCKFFYEYPELKERLILLRRRLELTFNRDLGIDDHNLLYLAFVAFGYTYNQKDVSLEEILSPYPVKAKVKHPSISHICHNFEVSVINKMIYSLFAKALNSGLAVSYEQILNSIKIKNTSFFALLDNLLYNHSLWFHDLLVPQRHTNNLVKSGIYKQEDIPRMVLQATPTITYDVNAKIQSTFSPQFLLINSYFNYPRYESLKVPMSLIDVYGFSDEQERMLINFINCTQVSTLATYFTYFAMYINLNDTSCLASAQKNAYRTLLPMRERIRQDRWEVIEKLCKRDFVQTFTTADYIECKAGIKHLLVDDATDLHYRDIAEKKGAVKLRRDAMHDLEQLGSYATMCKRNGVQPTAEDFKKWVENR